MNQTQDAVVIGAGIIGTSIAWRLAQRGLSVTILDSGAAGREASWAGAGMLAPGGEVFERTHWSDFALRSRSLYGDFVAELEEETGCRIDYQANGAIEIAASESAWASLRDRAECQRLLGIPSEPAGSWSLFFPDDGIVDPRDVVRALLAACRSRGVRLIEHTAAMAIRAGKRSVVVDTATGALSAAIGVLAAGAWSGGIRCSPDPVPGSFPVRGHLIGYRLAPGLCPTILRNEETYILQRASGLLIAGSSTENAGFDRRIDQAIAGDIARRAEALLPCLSQAPAPEAWLGFRPRADAHRPMIGRHADSSLWLAYGHFRNGILLAPATAERIASQIMSTSEMDLPSPSGNR